MSNRNNLDALYNDIGEKLVRYNRIITTLAEVKIEYSPKYIQDRDKVYMLPISVKIGKVEHRDPKVIALICDLLETDDVVSLDYDIHNGNEALPKEVLAAEKVVNDAWRRHLDGKTS